MNEHNDQGNPEVSASKKAAKKSQPKRISGGSSAKRTRTPRIYPALSFEESLVLADAIHTHASGEKVGRLTLLKAMNMSPTSSSTQILITSSGKYGTTKGSYIAEHLELTPVGKIATDKETSPQAKSQARFDLAIKAVKPFEVLYGRYRGKKLHRTMLCVTFSMRQTLTLPIPRNA